MFCQGQPSLEEELVTSALRRVQLPMVPADRTRWVSIHTVSRWARTLTMARAQPAKPRSSHQLKLTAITSVALVEDSPKIHVGQRKERLGSVNMKLTVGSTVTKSGRPPSEHGVLAEVGQDTLTVRWHLKQDERRGKAGTPVGKLFEDPTILTSDTPCSHCSIS